MQTSALLGAKTPDFSKLMVCSRGQRGVTSADKGRGQFCTDVLYGRSFTKIVKAEGCTLLELQTAALCYKKLKHLNFLLIR